MGSQRTYYGDGIFSEFLYEPIEGMDYEHNGIKCRVLKLQTDNAGTHSSIPQFAKTSNVYLVLGTDNKPKQMAVYENHRLVKDFDWTHAHTNAGDGQHFQKGVVHVHLDVSHSTNARYMNNDEIAKYGAIIQHYSPNAKLRP